MLQVATPKHIFILLYSHSTHSPYIEALAPSFITISFEFPNFCIHISRP